MVFDMVSCKGRKIAIKKRFSEMMIRLLQGSLCKS